MIRIVSVALLAAGLASAGFAAGAPKLSPDELANKRHNEALKLSDEGDEAANGRDEAKAKKAWGKALKKLEEAVKANASLHPAWSQLGYVKRRLGDLPGSLEAYDKALALSPDYLPAIEYLAETNLALGKLEEAKAAYGVLREKDKALAAKLEGAMSRFAIERSKDPQGMEPATVTEFVRWLAQQRKAARDAGEGYQRPINGSY